MKHMSKYLSQGPIYVYSSHRHVLKVMHILKRIAQFIPKSIILICFLAQKTHLNPENTKSNLPLII